MPHLLDRGGAVVLAVFAAGTGGNCIYSRRILRDPGTLSMSRLLVHFRPNLLAQQIYRNLFAILAEAPICPAIATGGALERRADLMD